MKRADAIWNKGPELIDDDGEVRELTEEDFKHSTPFSQLPAEERAFLLGLKNASSVSDPRPSEEVTLKLSSPVLEHFRAGGSGWENRLNEALVEWTAEHKAT